jgi:predicted MFS family arabinose efflux permease
MHNGIPGIRNAVQENGLQSGSDKVSAGRSFVPALMLAYFSTNIMDFLVSLFLLDVTATFFGSRDAVFVAITSQLATISSVCTVFAGIAIAFLTIKYRRKSILLIGSLCIPIGVLGCFLAPNLLAMQIFFPLDGIGTLIVGSLSVAIAGEVLPLSKRAKAMGFIVSSVSIASFIGALLIRYFFAAGDWRNYLLVFALPVSLAAVLFAYFGVPSTPVRVVSETGKKEVFQIFKQILKNRSAAACLAGTLIWWSGWSWVVFRPTFFRVWFGLPLASIALLALGNTFSMLLGSIISGHVIDRIGRKRQAVYSFVLLGVSVAIVAFAPNLWVAIAFTIAGQFLAGMGIAGIINMTVEQIPNYRGTIMSLGAIFVAIGAAVGAAVGGAVLALFGSYQIMALSFVAFLLSAAGIYFFFTIDPCVKHNKKTEKSSNDVLHSVP